MIYIPNIFQLLVFINDKDIVIHDQWCRKTGKILRQRENGTRRCSRYLLSLSTLFSFLLSPSFYWPIKKEKVKWSPYLQTMDHKMIRIVKYFFQKNSSVSVVFKCRPYFSKNKTRFGTPVLYFWCFSLLNKKLYFFYHHYLKREFCLMFLIN